MQVIINILIFLLLLGLSYRIYDLEKEVLLLKRDKINYLTKNSRFK